MNFAEQLLDITNHQRLQIFNKLSAFANFYISSRNALDHPVFVKIFGFTYKLHAMKEMRRWIKMFLTLVKQEKDDYRVPYYSRQVLHFLRLRPRNIFPRIGAEKISCSTPLRQRENRLTWKLEMRWFIITLDFPQGQGRRAKGGSGA